MPSSRFIKRFLATLLVVVAAIGQFSARGHYSHPVAATAGATRQYTTHHVPLPVFQVLAKQTSQQRGATVKRHKRPLISRAFQPVVSFIFIKRFRLVDRVVDYSSAHILQRPAVVFALRGPPVRPYAIA